MNRWDVYSYLKSVNGKVTIKEIQRVFKGIKEIELLEGVIEYSMAAERNGNNGPFRVTA